MGFLCDMLIQAFHRGESYLLHNPDDAVFFTNISGINFSNINGIKLTTF